MIDIEALDTVNSAIVLSVGAVLFDLSGTHRELYLKPSIVQQIVLGRTSSKSTIDWWKEQTIPIPEGTGSLIGVFTSLKEMTAVAECVWFRGPTYDHCILEHLAGQLDIELPWKFWQVRDSRTLDSFSERRTRSKEAVAHNALSDAKEQALDVIAFELCLKKATEVVTESKSSTELSEESKLEALVTSVINRCSTEVSYSMALKLFDYIGIKEDFIELGLENPEIKMCDYELQGWLIFSKSWQESRKGPEFWEDKSGSLVKLLKEEKQRRNK